MGKMANLAASHGIQNLDEALMRRSIRDELENHQIPDAAIRRPHYKPPGHPARSAMDELSDTIKTTLPPKFNDIPNNVVNSLVKLVISSDESDAKAAARKALKKELALREQVARTATAESGFVNQERIAEDAVEVVGLQKDLAAFDFASTKRIKAIQEEREMEALLEARARRALATLELSERIKEIDRSDSARAINARPPQASSSHAIDAPAPPRQVSSAPLLALPPSVEVNRKGRKPVPSREPTGLASLTQAPIRPLPDMPKKRNRVVFAEGTKPQ